MSSLALYRKHRPQSFAEVIGQEHVTTPLISALRNGKLNHAYLFSGPRGCGKTSSARILARSLNCAKGPTPDPCGECESCVALGPHGSGSLDVIEIDAASHGGVDDARELRERAFFAPVNSRYKIYIIDEAHMVSSAGFNALLKLVEEPPDFVKFVFATTEPDKVLQTIRSRTHHYPFRLIPPGSLRNYLEQLCKIENAEVEPAVLPLVVKAGGGSARDTLSILDQMLAGAGPEGVTYQQAVALLGVTDSTLIDEACEALAAADGGALLKVVNRLVDAGHDPRRFASDLLERLRDLLILDKVSDAANKGLIDVPSDELEHMTAQALRLGSATLSRVADILHDALMQMRGTTSSRLLLELACARMLLPAGEDATAAMMQRLERLERRFAIAGEQGSMPVPAQAAAPTRSPIPSAPAPVQPAAEVPVQAGQAPAAAKASVQSAAPVQPPSGPAPVTPAVALSVPPVAGSASTVAAESVPRPAPEAPEAAVVAPTPVPQSVPAGEVGVDDVRRLWPDIMERLKKRRVVWMLMQNATPLRVDKDELILSVQHQGIVRRISDDAVVSLMQETLRELLGVRWRLSAVVGDAPVGEQSVAASAEPAWPQVAEPAPSVASAVPEVVPAPAEPTVSDEPDMHDSVLADDAEIAPTAGATNAVELLERQLGARKISESTS
ncbi:MAG: DNA polymerase III subunit gamma and tau [Corynebacteriales bacterium]|nr:DNA polymerase III subunit gamma and tau [Mycobacteriales bacterium]